MMNGDSDDDSEAIAEICAEQLTSESRRRAREAAAYAFKPYVWREEVPQTPMHGKRVPKERSGHRIVFHDGHIYSFGGYNPHVKVDDPDLADDPHWQESAPLFKELWRFNVHSRRWTKLKMHGDIPDQLASHTALLHGGRLLVYGGTGAPFGLTTSNQVYCCDLRNNTWREIALNPSDGGQSPTPLYGQAVALTDENFYTVGGTSGFHYHMDVHKLSLADKRWHCLFRATGDENEPRPRYRHELCVYKDRLILLGGGTSFEVNRFNALHGFNLATRSWEWIATKPDPTVPIEESLQDQFPKPRRCHSAIQVKNYVFIFGGYDGDVIFSDCWRLDLASMAWIKFPCEMPIPVYFQASTITDSGKILTFGGVCALDSNDRSNRVFGLWSRIPSLRAIAWEAVNHYAPTFGSRRPDRLLEAGVPQDLIQLLQAGSECSAG